MNISKSDLYFLVLIYVFFLPFENKFIVYPGASQGGATGKEPACQCRRPNRHRFNPWVRKIPWSRKWQPIPIFFLENSMGRRAWRATVQGVPMSQRQLSTNHMRCCGSVAKLCLTLLQPHHYSPPGSSFHGVSQARILEWVSISFSRGSSQPRDQTHISLCLLYWQMGSLPLVPLGCPRYS